jgi:rhamnosyl/mannosyltransferase
MRILQVGKFYPPAPGGIETAIRALSEGLVAAGNTVTTLCFSESMNRSEETIGGVRVIRIPNFATLFSQPLNPKIFAELRKLAENADLVNLHMPNPLAEVASLALPGRIPIVVTYHSDVIRQRALLPFYKPVAKTMLTRARKIIVGSRFLRDDSSVLRAFSSKCAVVPYGLSPGEFVVTPSIETKTAALEKEHAPFALFVGRLVPYKGLEYLIRAQAASGVNVVIAGDGPLREELEKLAKESGAKGVRFLGRVDGETLAALYRSCLALILPSVAKTEAFGLVQVEAMAWGKPSIVSRLDSGIIEVNEEGKTALFVPPRDSGALSVAIRALAEDASLRETMGKAARQRFEEKFDPRGMIDSYLKIYRESTSS